MRASRNLGSEIIPPAFAITDPSAAAESWRRYVQRHAATNPTTIATVLGISRQTVMSWNHQVPSADVVLHFASTYNCSAWEALNAAGLIQAAAQDRRALLSAFSTQELATEAKRRVDENRRIMNVAALDDRIDKHPPFVQPVLGFAAVDNDEVAAA